KTPLAFTSHVRLPALDAEPGPVVATCVPGGDGRPDRRTLVLAPSRRPRPAGRGAAVWRDAAPGAGVRGRLPVPLLVRGGSFSILGQRRRHRGRHRGR